MLKGLKAPAVSGLGPGRGQPGCARDFREFVIDGPLPTGLTTIPVWGRQVLEQMETICYWCELPITISVSEACAKLIPICCSRCKNYFWF